MSAQELVTALARTEAVLRRRPSAALHDDPPAVACWKEDARVVARHPGGREVETDLAVELGGAGGLSPGWLVRAALANCTATCVALQAARAGIALDLLEVTAMSRSDARGLLGMVDVDGAPVYSGFQALSMEVRIAARGVPTERLKALVEAGQAISPMTAVVSDPHAMGISIEVAN